MAGAYKGLEAFFDIRHDHQIIDDRIRRFRGNNARLGNPQILAVADALLGMTDGRTFHRPLHSARTTAGADVQSTQSHLIANNLGVIVLFPRDGMSAPAHDQFWVFARD